MAVSTAFNNTIIRASAGTGKTYRLSSRFISLLYRGAECDRILATTFTRKAAGEIINRVLLRLAEASQDAKELQQLADSIEAPELTRDETLALLETTMRNLHRLRIGTIDAFFSQLAGSFSFELGLPTGWQLVNDVQAADLRDEAIEFMLREGDQAGLLTLMHQLAKGENQRSVGQLMRNQVENLYSLFRETDKGAWFDFPRSTPLKEDELAETLEALRTLPIEDKRQTKARDQMYLDAISEDWQAVIKKGLGNKVLTKENRFQSKPLTPELIQIIQKVLDHVAAVQGAQIATQTEATYRLLEQYDVQLTRLKRDRRAVRFEDITHQLAQHMSQPDKHLSGSLDYRLDGRIDHLLLDEFQDTSAEQWRAVRPFARKVTGDHATRSFFCVGDPKQAIYGWRGGEAEIFSAIQGELGNVDEEPMTSSWRSSSVIIDVVNQVFSNLQKHPNLGPLQAAVESWQSRFQSHTTHRKNLSGFATLETAPIPRDGEKEKSTVLLQAAARAEALVHENSETEIAVLVYTNAEIGEIIYELKTRGIAASEEGGIPATDSAAVQVLLSLCQLADHPGDTIARFHLSHSPIAGEIGVNPDSDSSTWQHLARRIRDDLMSQGYGPVITNWAKLLAPSCDFREIRRLRQVVELAYQYQSQATLRPIDFIRFVEQEKVKLPTAARVRVMTIHQAKGLEFDSVVLPITSSAKLTRQAPTLVTERKSPTEPATLVCRYANEEIRTLLPPRVNAMFAQSQQREVAESLCTLYVALTRAVHSLHIVIPASASSEKTFPRSMPGVLRATLVGPEPLDGAAIHYQHGDTQWYGSLPDPQEASPSDSADDAPALRIRLKPIDRPSRSLPRKSPSNLEGGARVALAQMFQAEGEAARQRGTLIHALFEQCTWHEDGAPSDQQLTQAAHRSLLPMERVLVDIPQHVTEFKTMLAAAEIHQQLQRDAYHERAAMLGIAKLQLRLYNEYPLAVRSGNELLTGFIDRLVLLCDGDVVRGAEIVDYKTDAFDAQDTAAVEAKVKYYQPQLAAYAQAIASQHALPLDAITAKLIFVTQQVIASVPCD